MLVIRRVPERDYSRYMVAEIQFADENGIIPEGMTFPQFALNTYDCLKDPSDKGRHVYDLVNAFLATFTVPEQRELFDYYSKMKELINTITVENVRDIRKGPMTDLTTSVMTKLNVAERCIMFIARSDINFPAMPDGMREHDTKTMTFRLREYVELTAVSLFSKMVSPIWGDFINVMKKPTMVNEFDKEMNCYLIIIDVLRTGAFKYIHDRFTAYLRPTVVKVINQADSTGRKGSNTFALSGNGFVPRRLQDTVYAITLVKKFVIHDVRKLPSGGTEPPNIMTYAYDVLIKTARSKLSNMRDKAQFLERFELAENSGAADNTTIMDHNSRSSRIPYDYPRIARVGAEFAFDRFIDREGLPRDKIMEAMRFHETDIVRPNVLNRAICASIFARELGGSTLLNHLRREAYTKMVVLAQFFMVKKGLRQIIPYMTAVSDEDVKTGATESSVSRVVHCMTGSAEYRECVEYFPASALSVAIPEYLRDELPQKNPTEMVGIASQVTRIQTWICMYSHWYNVSPQVWEALGVEMENVPMHGAEMKYGDDIMREVCRLFLDRHKYVYQQQGGLSAPAGR